MLLIDFGWKEPTTGKSYTILSFEELAVIPRVGETVEFLMQNGDLLFAVDKVEHIIVCIGKNIIDGAKTSHGQIDQGVYIYVQPMNADTWRAIEQIKAQQDLQEEQKNWVETQKSRREKPGDV